jgi:uncharacterized protein YqjF (DUF2071 family)
MRAHFRTLSMSKVRPFLTACWQDLAIITYAAPPEALRPRLPRGLELDARDGKVYASLVAFDFRDCCVRGVRWPGLVNFPEVNLRFYVREPSTGRRGVVFVREFVPSRLIAWVARAVYNEPYLCAAMTSRVTDDRRKARLEHELHTNGAAMRITAEADSACFVPDESSWEHFFKEHSWGFGTDRRGRTLVYEVRHPIWQVRCNATARVEGDIARVYGPEWAFLKDSEPVSVVFAVGSGIEVLPCGPL